MALDPYDLRQTPQIITPPGTQTQPTPAELQNMYQYAQMLSKSSQQPIHGGKGAWLGGVANMVDALMGGYTRGQADALGRQPEALALKNMQPAIPSPFNMPTSDKAVYDNAPSSKEPAPQGGALNLAPTGSSDDFMDRAAAATSKQESGGKYGEIGVPTKYGRALGKYQIMPENVSRWSKEVLGKELSPQEFLADTSAQDQIYRTKMRQYIDKYGVEGAGRAWLGGEGSINKPDRRDTLGTSVGDYGKRFASLMGGAVPSATAGGPALPGAAMAFNGQPAAPAGAGGAPNAQDAIVTALAGGGAAGGAAKPAMPTQVVQATGPLSANAPPPAGILPGQSKMTPTNLNMILNNNHIDPAVKAWALQQYMGTQVNPQTVQVAGGRWIIPADRKQAPYYVPDLQKGTVKLGDMSIPRYSTLGPGGQEMPGGTAPTAAAPAVPARPPAAAAPPPAPSITNVPVKPGLPAGPNVLQPPGGALPFMSAPPPGPQGTAPEAVPAPTKVASLAPDVGVPVNPVAVPPMGAGPLGTSPPPVAPAASPAAAVPTMTKPTAPLAIPPEKPTVPPVAPPPIQLAQNTAGQNAFTPPFGQTRPDILRPEEWDAYRKMKDYELGQKTAEKGAEEGAKHYAKRLDDMSTGAAKVRDQVLPHLQQSLAMLDQPGNFYSGPGNQIYTNFKNIQAGLAQLFPNAGFNEYSGAPNQIFNKGIAAAVLNNMQTALAGLGQVRIAEIDLLKQAMASPHNTVEANRTLLNMAIRVSERLQGITAMAQDYASGADVINPFSGKNEVLIPANPDGRPRNGGNIDANFDRLVNKISKEHPAFTPEEIQNQKGVWDKDKAAPKAEPPAEKKYPKPSPTILQQMRKDATQPGGLNEDQRKSFEKWYGPVNKYLAPAQGK